MQTIEQVAKLYKDAMEEVRAAEIKAAKHKKILEEMRSQVEAALGIEKKPVYREPLRAVLAATAQVDSSIGGDGRTLKNSGSLGPGGDGMSPY